MLKLTNMARKENLKAYLFLAPALVLASIFLFLPLIKAFASSFLRISQGGNVLGFAGVSNYARLFSDKGFLNALGNTAKYIALFVPLNTAATLLAATLTRRRRRFTSSLELVFASPIAISLASYCLIFKEMFRGKVSVVNRLLSLDVDWLSERFPALMTLAILGVFLDFGLDYLLLTASFRSIDKDILDAARLDGASDRQVYSKIELPLIKRMLITTILIALKDALMISSPIIILTEGGPFRSTETVMFYYYIEAFKSGNRAIQNSLSVLMTMLFIAFMAIYAKRRGKDEKLL